MSDAKSDDAKWPASRWFLLLLAAALLAAFPAVALGWHTFFYRDFGALGYPGAFFNRACLWHGEWPLWNPYSHCGVPWLAQMGQWYPPNWLACFLPLPWSENFLILVHLWFGGWGMFRLARQWGNGDFAAAFAGFAFIFNGVMLSCLLWGNYIASLAWLPWVTIGVMMAWRNGGRYLAPAALAGAMQVLTATPEITLLSWLFLGAVWLGEVFSGETRFFVSTRRISGVILLTAGITMVQMLPFFDLLTHSQRHSDNAEAALWSMPGWGWANLLVPLFHCYQSPQGPWFQNGQEFLASYYPGLGVLALAAIGLWLNRSRVIFIAAATVLFCWIMALGPHGFLYEPVKKIFPVIGIARFPIKFTILTAFLVPLLAAGGVEQIRVVAGTKTPRVTFGIPVLILLLSAGLTWFACRFPFLNDQAAATAWNALERCTLMVLLLSGIFWLSKAKKSVSRTILQLLILAILPLDALSHSPHIVPTLPSSALAPGIWQASGEPNPPELGTGRVMVSPQAEQKLLYSQVADMGVDFTGKRLAEWYNLNLLDSIPKVTGAVTLRPAYFDQLEQYLYYTLGSHYGSGLADFLSAAWISSPRNPTQWQPRASFLPFITAGQKPIFARDETVLPAICASDFDPRRTVFLPEAARATVTATNHTDGTVTHSHFDLNTVEADVTVSAPSLVVLSQSYYHLWQAYVDEKPAPLWRANLAFQAVEVPAGSHHIKLIYHDPWFEAGAVISLLSLAACFLIWRQAPKIH